MIPRHTLDLFIQHVKEKAQDPSFKYADWFLKYHLEIVEQIALEACDLYDSVDRDFVQLLCWLHDYGALTSGSNEHHATLTEGRMALLDIGFSKAIIDTALASVKTIDAADPASLQDAPIEVKIVSSADAASHYVGPFYRLWWHENPDKSVAQLIDDNLKKSQRDWNRKMILPEFKEAFLARKAAIDEQSGLFPNKYF